MLTLRRKLASWALAVLLCQMTALFAAPLSACCQGHRAVAADEDCCPAGAHPPGQCPRQATSRSTSSTCRMQCDVPHGAQLLLTAIGVLPRPAVTGPMPVAGAAIAAPPQFLDTHATLPQSPPPRLS